MFVLSICIALARTTADRFILYTYVVHDIPDSISKVFVGNEAGDSHDPEHRQEVPVDLSDQGLLLWCVGHVEGAIGEGRLDTAAGGLDLIIRVLVLELGPRPILVFILWLRHRCGV